MLGRVICFIFVNVGIVVLGSQLGCSIGCLCDYQSQNMSCSNNKSFTAFPRYMVWCPENLRIEDNNISQMPSDALTPCGDTIVNMSLKHSGITYIEVGVFANFYRLVYLDLRYNKIQKIHENLFIGLSSISDIYFQYNGLQDVEMEKTISYNIPDNPVGNLWLNHNKLVRFEGGLPRGLKFMYAQDNLIEEIIPETSIFPLLSLETIYLDRNKIKNIRRRAFVGFLNDSWFKNEDSPLQNLKQIVLNDNQIEDIEPFAFEGVPTVDTIHLSGNNLIVLKPNMFRPLTQLKHLIITNSKVKYIETEAFRDLDSLIELNLSNNSITDLRDNVFADLPGLETLSLSHNKLRDVRKEIFYGLNQTKTLNISANEIKHLKTASFKDLNSVEILDLSYNLILTTEEDAFQNMSKLERLILDHNNIVKVQPLTYREIPSLRELSFQYNRITSLSPQLDEQLNILRTDLYLRGNTIEIPEPKEIMSLDKLITLDLSHNQLEDLPPGVFRKVSNLFALHLNDNRFKYLRVTALKGLRRIYEINLHDNPLKCDCNMLGIWKYCTLNKIDTRIRQDEDLTCTEPRRYKDLEWHVLYEVENSTLCEPLKPLGAGNQAGLFVLGPILLVIIGILTFYTQKLMRKFIIK